MNDVTELREYAQGLRELADFMESASDVFERLPAGLTVNVWPSEETRETLEGLVEETGGEHVVEGSYELVRRRFGLHKVEFNFSRWRLQEERIEALEESAS